MGGLSGGRSQGTGERSLPVCGRSKARGALVSPTKKWDKQRIERCRLNRLRGWGWGLGSRGGMSCAFRIKGS